ncbi:MAG: amino acid ABC transporter ATP-binding protein [Lentisphaeria bacterium]|nr:amino acid ABC transporter ATP-binding protein [Lentisphaeria bacterium]
MNTAENTSDAPVILAANRISIQDRYSMERLRDLSLEIRKGDVIALIGASEPAKRLLLRCLDLLDKPEGGNVELNGEPVMWRHGGADRARRSIGMVFSRESLFRNLSVMGNMMIAPVDGAEEDERVFQERAKSLLKFAGLSGAADEMPINLSAGQRQRLAIVRALMLQPRILLVEDPGADLLPAEKNEVYALLRAVVKDGMTVMFSTRDLEFAREIATRVVFMADGMAREDGSAKDVLDHPQYDRTQAFVRKNTGFYRELNARAFDIYEFEGAIETFAIGKLISSERRRKLCDALRILLVKMIFPHVTRIILMLNLDPKTGDMVAVIQYPGTGFDPLNASENMDADAAKTELLACVKSAKYNLPASGKNEVTVTV